MATFVLLSKVSSKGAKQIKSLAKMDGEFDRQLQKHCPEVRRMASYALLAAYDFLHIFEAPDAKVGLAVDGSASNDSSHMLAEARMAMLLQRVQKGAGALSAQEALEMATLGGAAVLGRDDIGSLSPGKAADFIAINLDRFEYAGAGHDPLGALLFCRPVNVDLSVINGRVVVEEGHIVGFDLERAIARQNEISQEMLKRAAST